MRYSNRSPYYFAPQDDWTPFPPVEQALTEPNGLIATGGRLSTRRLLMAYRQGIFPWFNEGQPVLWWSPDPRMVLFPNALKVSASLRKTLRQQRFTVSMNQDFAAVISACAQARPVRPSTWITPEMQQAYIRLHQQGYAHSVETWQQGELVGGLYGVQLGSVFFGESMFSTTSDASKVALHTLVQHALANSLQIIDCQVPSDHLQRMGAVIIPRTQFNTYLTFSTE